MFDYESGTVLLNATPHWFRREQRRRGRVGAAIELLGERLGPELVAVGFTEEDITIELRVRKGGTVEEVSEVVAGIVRDHLEPLDRMTVCWTTQPDIGVIELAAGPPDDQPESTSQFPAGKPRLHTVEIEPRAADIEALRKVLSPSPRIQALRARLAPLKASNGLLSPLAEIFDDFLAGGES